MTDFRDREIERLAGSGWSAPFVRERGLPAITGDYLRDTFSPDEWLRAEQAAHALREHFSSARFADEVSYGVLLVPAPGLLDPAADDPATVGSPGAAMRRDSARLRTQRPLDLHALPR